MRVFGICGKSKGGRSDLVSELVARFRLEGMRVGIVKRAPLSFDLDTAGTDSYRQRQSGCAQMLIASDRRLALMEEYPTDSASPELKDLITRLKPADIVLAINFRDAEIPRIEVLDQDRSTRDERNLNWILARVAHKPIASGGEWFAYDDLDRIARFVLANATRWGAEQSEQAGAISPWARLQG